MLDAQPTTVYPASPDDPLRNSKLDFGQNITAFISWPLFCRQLSLSGWTLTRHVDIEIYTYTCTIYIIRICTSMCASIHTQHPTVTFSYIKTGFISQYILQTLLTLSHIAGQIRYCSDIKFVQWIVIGKSFATLHKTDIMLLPIFNMRLFALWKVM